MPVYKCEPAIVERILAAAEARGEVIVAMTEMSGAILIATRVETRGEDVETR